MKRSSLLGFVLALVLSACQGPNDGPQNDKKIDPCNYVEFETPTPVQMGGVQMIELEEGHEVWTKRFGNNPDIKVLLLHGGPALTHEYMECFESFFPSASIEFYHYDQLGSKYSDQPDNDSLWTLERFVDEVEQVRKGLGLNKDNFYILGNSWGGILGLEYALKYQQNLKGLIISNMTADFHKYGAYNASLRARMRPSLIDSLEYYEERGEFTNPEYADLVFNEFYRKHICRLEEWPEPILRSFDNINQHVYELIQGPSEFVPGGLLKDWTVWDRLGEISVPTLMIGAKYDTMNPEEMEEMSKLVQKGDYLYCANGSHLAMWDEQDFYMKGVINWIYEVHRGEK